MARRPAASEAASPSIELINIDKLVPYARNSRTHSAAQVAQIAGSMREFGWTNPILIDAAGTIVAGHGRVLAARYLIEAGQSALPNLPDLRRLPCVRLPHLTPAQRRAYVIADNKLALNAEWDMELLAAEVRELQNAIDAGEADFDLDILGFDDAELADLIGPMGDSDGDGGEAATATLAERFGVVPFSVLNAREGWWQDRKRAWIGLGIRSEVGRGENLLGFSKGITGAKGGKTYDEAKAHQSDATAAHRLTFGEIDPDKFPAPKSGTSIFDPVLCELAYRWFCPDDGLVLDPFAGGSVRGLVASRLGRPYVGIDLRPEQIEANRAQWREIGNSLQPEPRWITGDSRQIAKLAKGTKADFLFTCPPYGDLERYSDDPADISTMTYPAFLDAFREIIAAAAGILKPNRFAAVVVGEIRDGSGLYRDFVGDTVQAFRDAGMAYYNEAILVTALGSLPIRVGKQFVASRKLGKTHQNVLVFVKGDPAKATAALSPPEFGEIAPDAGAEAA